MTPRRLLLILLVIGCSKDASTPPASAPPASAPPASTPPASTPPASTPSLATGNAADPCVDIRKRFDAALATRTDACVTAADCGCYNPVGGPHLGCGGVADVPTIAKLAAIEREFHARSCAWTHSCAAWACTPTCVNKRCTR